MTDRGIIESPDHLLLSGDNELGGDGVQAGKGALSVRPHLAVTGQITHPNACEN